GLPRHTEALAPRCARPPGLPGREARGVDVRPSVISRSGAGKDPLRRSRSCRRFVSTNCRLAATSPSSRSKAAAFPTELLRAVTGSRECEGVQAAEVALALTGRTDCGKELLV